MTQTTKFSEEAIRLQAYLLWEMEGRQDGLAEKYWHRAVERMTSESCAAYPPAQSSHHRY